MADFQPLTYAQQSPQTQPQVPPQFPPQAPNIPSPQAAATVPITPPPPQNAAPYLQNAPGVNQAPQSNSKYKLIIIISIVAIVVIISVAAFLLINKKSQTPPVSKDTSGGQLTTANDASTANSLESKQVTESVQTLPLENSDPALYANSALGISFKGPQDWEKVEGQGGLLVVFRDVKKEIGENNLEFYSNLSLIIEPLRDEDKKITLEQYAKSANTVRASSVTNYVLLGSTKDKLGGENAYIDDYTMTLGSINVRQRQVYTLKNGNVFLFTFSGRPETWDSYLLTFDTVRSTFKFTGTVSGAKTRNTIVQGALGAFVR